MGDGRWHETIGKDLPAGLRASFVQGFEEKLAIFVGQEYFLAPIAAIHHVVNRACIFNSKFSRHAAAFFATTERRGKTKVRD
jgi:hypothetical protein